MTAKKPKATTSPARNDVMKVYATEGDNPNVQVATGWHKRRAAMPGPVRDRSAARQP